MFDIDDKRKRLATKRFNERIKLLATGLNGSSIVTIGAAVVAPGVGGLLSLMTPFWIIAAVVLHSVAQAVLGLLRDEG